jgi:mannose-1-phosphate guanylyltransferase
MKAMVLCAGLGTRLGDLTRTTPKPMLDLHGQPLLVYILRQLQRHGFGNIAINLHFQPEQIRRHFGDGTRLGLHLAYSIEDRLLGTAGGLKRMEEFFRGEPEVLVHYGDILTDQDWSEMLRFHRDRQALVTLLVHQRTKSNSIVALNSEGRITAFLERPGEAERQDQTSTWVNSGVCVCSPAIFPAIPTNQTCDLPRDVFPRMIPTGQIYGFPLSGYRCAIDSAERLAEARAALVDGRCRISLSGPDAVAWKNPK